MPRQLTILQETFPIAGKFTISRGSKIEAEVVACIVADGPFRGRGECVPYRRYGESLESVVAAIESARPAIEGGISIDGLQTLLPPGAARNALDCALWDLRARMEGVPVHSLIGMTVRPAQLETAYTISLGTPEEMAAQARRHAHRPLLKIKVGGDGDMERLQAVAESAPAARIIVDANEGWNSTDIEQKLHAAARLRLALVEQPLPVGQDAILREIPHPVPVCADESVHVAEDLDALEGLYDAVNIKLDKAGGLTAALQLRNRAREKGFAVMVGCMVGTSLAMAPATLVAQGADFVDLDGPLLLARDREPALVYSGSIVSPPEAGLWG